MFGSVKYGANAYANVGVETGVAAASPHKLISMLLEGAMTAVTSAMSQIGIKDIPGKGQSISKAINIIDNGLRASLNKDVGGDIALNLDALYEYMSMRLMLANIKNDTQILQEIHGLLGDIRGAWDAIGKTENPNVVPISAPQKTAAYDPLAPRVSNLVRA